MKTKENSPANGANLRKYSPAEAQRRREIQVGQATRLPSTQGRDGSPQPSQVSGADAPSWPLKLQVSGLNSPVPPLRASAPPREILYALPPYCATLRLPPLGYTFVFPFGHALSRGCSLPLMSPFGLPCGRLPSQRPLACVCARSLFCSPVAAFHNGCLFIDMSIHFPREQRRRD